MRSFKNITNLYCIKNTTLNVLCQQKVEVQQNSS